MSGATSKEIAVILLALAVFGCCAKHPSISTPQMGLTKEGKPCKAYTADCVWESSDGCNLCSCADESCLVVGCTVMACIRELP